MISHFQNISREILQVCPSPATFQTVCHFLVVHKFYAPALILEKSKVKLLKNFALYNIHTCNMHCFYTQIIWLGQIYGVSLNALLLCSHPV